MAKNWIYNGKRIKIIDTRIDVSEDYEKEPVFVDKEFYLAIWDKSLKIDIGSAKQLANGEYVGYIPCGMHVLTISGATVRALADHAYVQHLISLDS